MPLDAIALGIFASRLTAICDEMGTILRKAALSPNIRDRLDLSCAVFDGAGELCAQAAHIPVHLGSMAYATAGVVGSRDWAPGDMVVLNDPFLGGTHLPDVTLIAPLHAPGGGAPIAFVANRAHHADIGASSPGSMPVSRTLEEEGLVIPPTRLMRAGLVEGEVLAGILAATRSPSQARGDFLAQVAANRAGLARLGALVEGMGPAAFRARTRRPQRLRGATRARGPLGHPGRRVPLRGPDGR